MRKKQSEVPTVAAGPVRIHCPACKSEISSDGATLHARSKNLDDLIETDAVVPELEKEIERLEAKLKATERELQQEKAKSAVPAVAPTPKREEPKNVAKKTGSGSTGSGQPKRGGLGEW